MPIHGNKHVDILPISIDLFRNFITGDHFIITILKMFLKILLKKFLKLTLFFLQVTFTQYSLNLNVIAESPGVKI